MESIPQVPQALAVIKNVCEMSSTIWVNKHQCKHTADRFSAIGEGLKGLRLDKNFGGGNASDGSSSREYPAFDELLTVLRKGETLVSKYDKSKGISSVVIGTDNREAFKEIHEELDTMKAQFDFESFSEPGDVKDFESNSRVDRTDVLTADAEMDLKENLEVLDQMTDSEQTTGMDMEKVTQVVSEKCEPRRASNELPSYLNIDPTTIEIKDPVREYVRQSQRDPKDKDGWALVRFGKWLGCDFAIKVFKSNAVDAAGWNMKQLSMEVGSLEKLRHPHIVRFVGFGQDSERCVLLMELMDTDLRDFMRKKLKSAPEPKPRPFTRSEELDIITQIAKGMYYLHTQQYSHGDLKCSNILVKKFDDYLDVKIADLRGSLNLKVWDAEAFKQISMTRRPRWTAPEAIKHYGWVEPSSDLLKKSDVYSFGMTCYEVVTGKYPFDGIRGDELLKQIEAGKRPELPEELDENLKGLIKECWDHNPNKRPEFENICYLLDYIRSKKPIRFFGKDVVLSLTKWIPQVHGLLTGLLGVKRQSKAQTALQQSEGAILAPEYLKIQPDKLIKVRPIGKGGSAGVYEATWLGCTFAVKVFKTDSPTQKLQQEVDYLIKLSRHPCIVQMVGLSVESNHQCSIVLELMSTNLREIIESRILENTPMAKERGKGILDWGVDVPFDLHVAVLIIRKIALGMAFLHSKGVVHRDLKSLNVMVNEHPGNIDVKIVDFGMSHHEHNPDPTEIRGLYVGVGTGFWRAPEILPTKTADRSKKFDLEDLKATDVYSFAMTCYEVLTGKVPFDGQLTLSEYDKVISGMRPTLPSDLNPELKALMERCWHKDPVERPNFTEICEELQKIQQALPSSIR